MFLVDPVEDVLVVSGDTISLNCSAQGNPLPTISWMVANSNGNVTTIDVNFNAITASIMEVFTQTSVVSFEADLMDPLRGNGTMVYCVATNSIMADVESNRTTVTIAGETECINCVESNHTALEMYMYYTLHDYYMSTHPHPHTHRPTPQTCGQHLSHLSLCPHLLG